MLDMITNDPVLLFTGVFLLVTGAALMVAPGPWRAMLASLQESAAAPALAGMAALAFGLAVVIFYASWDGAARIVLTLFGWAALAEAAIYLFFPQMLKQIVASGAYRTLFRFGGPVCIVCGAIFLLA